MLATLRKSCATKQAEVEKSKALRQQELVALSETIKARPSLPDARVDTACGFISLSWHYIQFLTCVCKF